MAETSDTARQAAPKWLNWVAALALLWNLLGFAALAMDTLQMGPPLTPEQADYAAAVPIWAKAASWIAVGAGIAGCLLLFRRQVRAVVAFAVSLLALIVQNVQMFVMADTGALFGPTPMVMQAMVAIIAAVLLWLAISARSKGWLH